MTSACGPDQVFDLRIRDRTARDLEMLLPAAERVRELDRYPGSTVDLRAFLSDRRALGAWVAEQDRQTVGHVALHQHSAPPVLELACQITGRPVEGLGVVARLLVAPEYRRQGVGRQLLGRAVQEAWDRGLWPVLDTAVTNS